MKTFDEAFKTVVSLVTDPDATPEVMQRLADYQHDRATKHRDLSIEIQRHRILNAMLDGITDSVLCSEVRRCECVIDTALKVFTLGVQIGMEMEKQEGGITL